MDTPMDIYEYRSQIVQLDISLNALGSLPLVEGGEHCDVVTGTLTHKPLV